MAGIESWSFRLLFESVEKVGELGFPSEMAKFCIFDGLVGPCTLVGELALSGGREGLVEVLCEVLVAFELAHRFVVGDVEDARVFSLG